MNSLVISVIVGIIATLLGFALSYGLHFTRIPLGAKKVFSTIFSLPMLLSTITYGYVLLYTFGRQGLLTQILGFQLFDIYGNVGVILGLVIYATPITFLLFSDGMRYIETKYEIVSKLLGDAPFQTFKISILIPLLRVFGISFVQSFFMSFTDFGIPTESDIDEMYARFKEVLLEDIPKYSGVKPGAIKLFDTLRDMGIKIGSTTGYNQQMANLVNDAAKEQGLVVDDLVNVSDTNDIGRPYPYMIFKCMEELEIVSVDQVMKVGDTTVDIEEGINAGVYSVGLIEGSSQLGLDEDEVKALSASEKEERYPQVKEAYEKAGAHEVVTSLADIADLVERLNQQEK